MEQDLYNTVIGEAMEALPAHIREEVKDVVVVVEERPMRRPGAVPIRRGQVLLGLYEGVPRTAWGREFSGKLPDKITLFRESIELVAGSPEDVPSLIRETLWHEIGHYFGLGHEKIHEMEKRWRKDRRNDRK
ncbi:MAG: metallopeptidase family protein [Candidatus Peribacteraceae bacterium]|jgi:predicted Zn-dependent protease with MMP-like domain